VPPPVSGSSASCDLAGYTLPASARSTAPRGGRSASDGDEIRGERRMSATPDPDVTAGLPAPAGSGPRWRSMAAGCHSASRGAHHRALTTSIGAKGAVQGRSPLSLFAVSSSPKPARRRRRRPGSICPERSAHPARRARAQVTVRAGVGDAVPSAATGTATPRETRVAAVSVHQQSVVASAAGDLPRAAAADVVLSPRVFSAYPPMRFVRGGSSVSRPATPCSASTPRPGGPPSASGGRLSRCRRLGRRRRAGLPVRRVRAARGWRVGSRAGTRA
jgi:hypothetical protein